MRKSQGWEEEEEEEVEEGVCKDTRWSEWPEGPTLVIIDCLHQNARNVVFSSDHY